MPPFCLELMQQIYSGIATGTWTKAASEARSRISAIAEGELVGKAVSKAIFIIQAATTLSAINGG